MWLKTSDMYDSVFDSHPVYMLNLSSGQSLFSDLEALFQMLHSAKRVMSLECKINVTLLVITCIFYLAVAAIKLLISVLYWFRFVKWKSHRIIFAFSICFFKHVIFINFTWSLILLFVIVFTETPHIFIIELWVR